MTKINRGNTVTRIPSEWDPGDLEKGDTIQIEGDGYSVTGKVFDYFVDGLHSPSVVLDGINGRQYLVNNVTVTVLDRPTPTPRAGMRIRNTQRPYTLVTIVKHGETKFHLLNDDEYTVSVNGWSEDEVAELFKQGYWTLVD